MNNYNGSLGAYGMIPVMALDYVFRLWARKFGKKDQRPAPAEPKVVAAPQTAIGQMATAPKACGC